MDNFKKIIKENIPVIIIAVTLITVIVAYKVIDYVGGKKTYYSGLNSQETVQYENKKYEENEYKVINVDQETMAQYYYKEIMNEIHNDPKTLWSRISDESKKEDYNNDYDKFLEDIAKIKTVTSKMNTLTDYGVRGDNNNIYILVDSAYNKFQVTEDGVWNIEVELLGKQRPENE